MYKRVPTSLIIIKVVKKRDETKFQENDKIPKVMSASSVTACGDTSEGSTAAKLEVASPKSPTMKNEIHVSVKTL
jgi:hypothetical protein